jgi:ribose transport system substrate-binding protein
MPRKTTRASIWLSGSLVLAVLTGGAFLVHLRRPPGIPTIAFIPQTAGSMLWEVEHFGATEAAEKLKCRLYWNAPTSENDLAGQVSLIDKVGRGKYQGLVLTPNHPLAMLAPLRRALATGLPVVIVSAPLDFPASGKLGYILNDDQRMGEIAAAEIAGLIHGQGSIALVGVGRNAPGIKLRAVSAERFLAAKFPHVHVVNRLGWAYNTPRAEEVTNGVVDSNPGISGILSFTAVATRGVYAALKSRSLQQAIRVVGCEQDSDLIGYVASGEIAAILAENTYRMGYEAVELISKSWAGQGIPARSLVAPLLITRQNLNTDEARLFTGFPR